MLFSVEQAFVGREEIRSPLKTPAGEASPAMARRAAKTGQEGSTVASTSSPKQYLKSVESFKQLSDVFTQNSMRYFV